MKNQLLATKFFIPPKQQNWVTRPRLMQTLDLALSRKLTLLSAPAGFGKTTLVSDWVSQCNMPVVWLSLDKEDADPKRFWLYFITALQGGAKAVGETSLSMLQQANSSPGEALLTTLVNEIAAVPEPFILVLDDFHLADAAAIDEGLTFLLDYLPPQMHLIMTTREDPGLPLARLRARAQLNEVRATNLRFTLSEAADFLNQFLGINLAEESIKALEDRTEGWIAGLQLAALSLQGNNDPEEFIASFSGSHHFVLDYLVEEVLEQQPEELQCFLMSTSILEHFCGDLCDALLPDNPLSGQEMLNRLEQANLFLVPLDHERRWYRYHKLFADLLSQRLLQSNIDAIELHIRASQWFDKHGLELEAFKHAVSANDIELAERLLTGGDVPLHFRGAMTPVSNWLSSLPQDVLDASPSLWVTYASVLTVAGKSTEEVEKVLDAAARALEKMPHETANLDLSGQVAAIRAMLAIPQNRIEEIVVHAQQALQLLDAENLADRTTAVWALAYGYQLQGKLKDAAQAHCDTLEISKKSGNVMISLGSLISLGQIAEQEYDLHAAETYYQAALDMAGDPPLAPASEAHLGMARIHYEWNDLDSAEEHIQKSLPLAIQMENVDTPLNCELLLAKIQLARRNMGSAATHLSNAEQLAEKEFLVYKRDEVASFKISFLLVKGHSDAAELLAQEHNLPLCQAEVYLAQGDASAAVEMVNEVNEKTLHAMLMKALAFHKLGNENSALEVLSEALKATQKGGLIRSYVDMGEEFSSLLDDGTADHELNAYIRKIQNAFTGKENVTAGGLIEPLSERELEIMQLIAQGLSNREISERLYLALDTIKGHNRKIFAKLQVQRRTEAVARVRELGLM